MNKAMFACCLAGALMFSVGCQPGNDSAPVTGTPTSGTIQNVSMVTLSCPKVS